MINKFQGKSIKNRGLFSDKESRPLFIFSVREKKMNFFFKTFCSGACKKDINVYFCAS